MGYHVPLGNQGWKPNKTHRTESSPRTRVEPISVREKNKTKLKWNYSTSSSFLFFVSLGSLALPVGILIPFSSGCWLLIYRYSKHLQVYAVWGWGTYLQKTGEMTKKTLWKEPSPWYYDLCPSNDVEDLDHEFKLQSVSPVGTNWNQRVLQYFCLH